ncbi:MAG: hypothetical protein IPK12_23595 [Gemmatimonadetes bacterium]|nr:hypothetical protein [Gemmatimonadota bacterium]
MTTHRLVHLLLAVAIAVLGGWAFQDLFAGACQGTLCPRCGCMTKGRREPCRCST